MPLNEESTEVLSILELYVLDYAHAGAIKPSERDLTSLDHSTLNPDSPISLLCDDRINGMRGI